MLLERQSNHQVDVMFLSPLKLSYVGVYRALAETLGPYGVYIRLIKCITGILYLSINIGTYLVSCKYFIHNYNIMLLHYNCMQLIDFHRLYH